MYDKNLGRKSSQSFRSHPKSEGNHNSKFLEILFPQKKPSSLIGPALIGLGIAGGSLYAGDSSDSREIEPGAAFKSFLSHQDSVEKNMKFLLKRDFHLI